MRRTAPRAGSSPSAGPGVFAGEEYSAEEDRAVASVRAAFETEPDWRHGMRAAIGAALWRLEENPGIGRAYAISETLSELVQRGIDQESTSPAMVDAVSGAIHRRLRTVARGADPRPFDKLTGELMYLVVLPCLGREAACAELHPRRLA